MKLVRSFPVLAFALVLLSIATLSIVQRSITLMLVAGTLAAISWYITEGPRGRSLPKWVSNILVIGVSLNVLVETMQSQADLLIVLGRFAVWLTVIKLYERRRSRDYAQLLTLSLLLMLTACLQSNDLIFGIMLILYAALGLYVLLLFQMYASYERERLAREAAVPADYRLVPPVKPITGLNVGWSFRAQTIGIAFAGIAVSIAVFVIFPRGYGAGMLGRVRWPDAARVSQFAWDVDLNAGGRITESRERVLTLQLRDENDQPIRIDGPLLLRGAVLDRYSRGKWEMRTGRERVQPFGIEFQPLTRRAESDPPYQPQPADGIVYQHFMLNRPANDRQPIFTIFAPTSVRLNAETLLVYSPSMQVIRTSERERRLLSYSVIAARTPTDEALEELAGRTPREAVFSGFQQSDSHRILSELADDVLRAANIPLTPPDDAVRWQWNAEVAAALTRHLHSPLFMYTTDLSSIVYRGTATDPIVQFLTEHRRGHCEFFASGLAALCQAKGVPARVVVGYVAYDYDETQQQYNVLAANAHAWAEVATGERRWTAFDPTPPTVVETIHSLNPTLADQMRWVYQRFEGNWSSNVANFDIAAQSQLADTLNQGWTSRLSAILDSIRDWMDRVNRAFYFGPAGYIWMGIVAFALAIAIIALVKLMRRSMNIRRTLQLQHVRGTEYQRLIRQLGFYLDMLHVLKRAGLPKPDWQPPMHFATVVADRDREAAQLVREITDIFYEARYGGQPLSRSTVRSVNVLVQRLAEMLRVRA